MPHLVASGGFFQCLMLERCLNHRKRLRNKYPHDRTFMGGKDSRAGFSRPAMTLRDSTCRQCASNRASRDPFNVLLQCELVSCESGGGRYGRMKIGQSKMRVNRACLACAMVTLRAWTAASATAATGSRQAWPAWCGLAPLRRFNASQRHGWQRYCCGLRRRLRSARFSWA